VRFQVEIRLGALFRDLAVGGFDRALLGRPFFATLVIEEAPLHQFVDDAQRKLLLFRRGRGKAFRQVDAEKAMTGYETAQKAFHANREPLKAERLAREAAGTSVAAKKTKPKKAR
jgi:hypothetical protein